MEAVITSFQIIAIRIAVLFFTIAEVIKSYQLVASVIAVLLLLAMKPK